MEKLHIPVPSSILTNGSTEEKAFYADYSNDTHSLKMLLVMLSIFHYNTFHNNNNDLHTIRLDNINSTKSFMRPLKLSKERITEICLSLRDTFLIDEVKVVGDEIIVFKVKQEYLRLLMNSKTVYVDFESIVNYRYVNHIKAHLKCQFFKNLNGNLNYFVDFFGNNKDASYSNKVAQVKRIFKAVKIVKEVKLNKKGKLYNIIVDSVSVVDTKKNNNVVEFKKKVS